MVAAAAVDAAAAVAAASLLVLDADGEIRDASAGMRDHPSCSDPTHMGPSHNIICIHYSAIAIHSNIKHYARNWVHIHLRWWILAPVSCITHIYIQVYTFMQR